MSVVWAASCDRNFGGMLENSFEHSEIRIAFQQAASEGTTKFADMQIFEVKSDCDKYLNKNTGLIFN